MPYLLFYYLCIIEIQLVCEESLKRKYKSSIKCSVKKSDKWSAYNHNQRSSGSWATAETWKRSLKFQRGGWDVLYHWFLLLRQQDQSSSRKTLLPGSCEFPGKRRGIIKKKKKAELNSQFVSENEEADKSPLWFRLARQKNRLTRQMQRILKAFLDFTCPYAARTEKMLGITSHALQKQNRKENEVNKENNRSASYWMIYFSLFHFQFQFLLSSWMKPVHKFQKSFLQQQDTRYWVYYFADHE